VLLSSGIRRLQPFAELLDWQSQRAAAA